MPRVSTMQTNFSAGELSPRLHARVGTEKYNAGLDTCKNAVVLPQGGVLRRSGFQYIAATKSSGAAVLVVFDYSTTQSYVLEFGNNYIRVYKDGAQVLSAPSTPVEIATTYTTSELSSLRFCQSLDTLYIVHPSHAPATLTRSSDTSWTLASITFTGGPFRTANTTATTITPSALTGAGVTLTASTGIFQAGHVGSLWKLSHASQVETVGIDADTTAAAQYSTNLATNGLMTLTITGTWTGVIYVQRSYDNGSTWETLATSYTANTTATLTEPATGTYYRVRSNDFGGTGTAVVRLSQTNAIDFGIARITGYTNTTVVTATVIDDFYSTAATSNWAEGAWSAVRGYPAFACFYENRLMLAANTEKPMTVWGSNTDDYYNFWNTTSLADSEAVEYTLLSRQMNAIRWMFPANRLRLGAASGEWWMSGATDSEPLTPSSVRVRCDTDRGSAAVTPCRMDDAILFPQRIGKKLFESYFDWNADSYVARDVSVLAEHLFRTYGITGVAYQQNPHSIVWCMRSDGTLVGVTYDKTSETVAWHRHETDGTVESLAVISGTDRDELWAVINRTINSSTVRYVERLAADFNDDVDCEIAPFMDSYASYNGYNTTTTKYLKVSGASYSDGASVTLTATGHTPFTSPGSIGAYYRLRSGTSIVDALITAYTSSSVVTATLYGDAPTVLQNTNTSDWALMASTLAVAHLEGETVQVLTDGAVHADCTVASGSITLDAPAAVVYAGLGFTTDIKTLRVEGGAADGTSQGRQKKIDRIILRLYQSRGLQVGRDDSNLDTLPFESMGIEYAGAPLPVFTGDYAMDFDGGVGSDGQIFIRQSQPLPMCVLGLVVQFETDMR